MAEKKTIVTIDPSLEYQRRMDYMERNAGWEIFKGVYWSIYIFVIGAILFAYVPGKFTQTEFLGLAVMLLAMFYVVYGFAIGLHSRTIKEDG